MRNAGVMSELASTDPITTLEVDRANTGTTRLITEEQRALEAGQVRLSIDRFAVTANNITYAVFGDMLGYWDFFPTTSAAWGRVPAMGWATVTESNVEGIAVGGRYYGWFPMASAVTFTATVTPDGFRDDGAHRVDHASVYRSYVRMDADAMYPDSDEGMDGSIDDAEDRHALLRGLALTGFLAEEFFADGGGTDEAYFGASRVVVLSASSKTALGFADRARRRGGKARGGVEVVGVTSAGNREMVESTDLYDLVVTYDEVERIETSGGTVSIDMAGNPAALRAVHEHFGDGLAYSMTVGRSHHDAEPPTREPLAGPEPKMFFAPSEVSRRAKQWGRDEYGDRCADSIKSFAKASQSWLTVEQRTGADGAQSAWADVHSGTVAPSIGLVVVQDSPHGRP